RLTLAIVVMARLVRATCRGTVLVQVARTSRAMTDLKSRTSIFRPIDITPAWMTPTWVTPARVTPAPGW
ncbi:MAG: hypothetical protein ABSA58_19575, partial [Acetobacteraceae bacterium]